MGCWSETCLVSNLPINAGDPVVAFLIAHDHYRGDGKDFSGTCYATDKAIPINLPIKADYNDYGSIEKFDENSLAVSHVKTMFKKRDFGTILERIRDDALYVKSYRYGQRDVGVGLVMIHEDIYNAVVQKISKDDKELQKKDIENRIKWLLNLKEGPIRQTEHYIMPGHLSYDTRGGVDELVEIIYTSDKDKNKIMEDAVDSLSERIIFNNSLQLLRKTWVPSCGKGSQQNQIRPYLILMEAMAKVAIKNKEPEQLYYEFLCD